MHDRDGILRIARSQEGITELLVNLGVLTKKITLFVSSSCNAKRQVSGIECGRTLMGEHFGLRDPLAGYFPDLPSGTANNCPQHPLGYFDKYLGSTTQSKDPDSRDNPKEKFTH